MAKTVRYYIDVDEKGAVKGAKAVEDSLGNVDHQSEKTGVATIAMGNIMADVASQMAAGFAQLVSQSQELFAKQEQAEQKAAAVIKATNGAAGFSIDELKKYAAEFQTYTTIGDEELLDSMSTMLTFRQVSGDTFKEAISLSADTAAIFGSLSSATLQIGKALEDPIEGMTALRRVGVTFNEMQKEQVKDFLAQNDLAGAQGVILDNLRGQLGGVAKELALTDTGKWEQFLNTLGDSQEELGGILTALKVGLIPTFTQFLNIADSIVGTLDDWFGVDLKTQLVEDRLAMNGLVLTITSLNEGSEERKRLMNELVTKYPEFIDKIDGETTSNGKLIEALEEVNDLYIDRAAIQLASNAYQDELAKAGAARVDQLRLESEINTDLVRLNEELGLGIDLTTGSTQERIAAAQKALAVDAEFVSTSKANQVARNAEASALQGLAVQEQKLAGSILNTAEAQRQAAQAGEFRTAVEDALRKKGSEVVEVHGEVVIDSVDFQAPELEIPNPDPIYLDIQIDELPEIDYSKFLLSDGTIATLNAQLAGIDLMPDSSINDLEGKLDQVNELYANAQTDAERERLLAMQEGLEQQLEARRQGIEVEELMQQESTERIKETLMSVADVGMNMFSQISQLQQAQYQQEIAVLDDRKKKALASIDAQLAKETLSEKERSKLLLEREKVETSYEEKTNNLKREAFTKEKRAKTFMAIAETAVAVVEALPNIPLSIAAGIMGALQVGIINSQPNPYYEGGLVAERMPDGMTSPGMKLITINENQRPEFVVNAESAEKFRDVLELINYQPEAAEEILTPLYTSSISNQFQSAQEHAINNQFATPFLSGGFTTQNFNTQQSSFSSLSYRINALAGREFDLPNLDPGAGERIAEAVEAAMRNLSIRLDVDSSNSLVAYIEGQQAKTSKDSLPFTANPSIS